MHQVDQVFRKVTVPEKRNQKVFDIRWIYNPDHVAIYVNVFLHIVRHLVLTEPAAFNKMKNAFIRQAIFIDRFAKLHFRLTILIYRHVHVAKAISLSRLHQVVEIPCTEMIKEIAYIFTWPTVLIFFL